MKKLTLTQMETIEAGSKLTSCLGQGLTGTEILGSIALLLTISNPIGWILLGVGAAGFALTLASDPHACD